MTRYWGGFFQSREGIADKPRARINVAAGQWLLVYPQSYVQFEYLYNAGTENEIGCLFPLLCEVGQPYVAAYKEWLERNDYKLITEEIDMSPYLIQQLRKV